jgi:aldehyde dehydrogenase (NAD+)
LDVAAKKIVEKMGSQLIEKTDEVREHEMLIGGEWVERRSGKALEGINPYTGRVWATAPEAGEEDVDEAERRYRRPLPECLVGTGAL